MTFEGSDGKMFKDGVFGYPTSTEGATPEAKMAEFIKVRQELANEYMMSELRKGKSLKDVEALMKKNFGPMIKGIHPQQNLEGNLEPVILWDPKESAVDENDFRYED